MFCTKTVYASINLCCIYPSFCSKNDALHFLFLHEAGHDVDGQREDDGGVLLSRDGVKSLKVAELEGVGRLKLLFFYKVLLTCQI